MRALVAALLLVGCAKDPCDGVAGECVSLHVIGEGVTQVDQLAVDLSGALTAPSRKTPPNAPERKSLPLDVGVAIPGAPMGDLAIHVAGFFEGSEAGEGSVHVQLTSGEHLTKTLTLTSGSAGDSSTTSDLALAADAATDGAIQSSADGSSDAARKSDLAPPPSFVQLVQGRFGTVGRFLAADEQLVQLVNYDSPQQTHIYDRKGNELPVFSGGPAHFTINGGAVFYDSLPDGGGTTSDLWVWHDGKSQPVGTNVKFQLASPDGSACGFLVAAGIHTADLWLAQRSAPGADFTVRKLASDIDTTVADPILTFAANGTFYWQDSTFFNVWRLTAGDTTTSGTEICDNCFPFVPNDDGTQVAAVANVGADGIGQIAVAPIGLGSAMTVGTRSVGFSFNFGPYRSSYSSTQFSNAPLYATGSNDIAYLGSNVDGGFPNSVNYLINNDSFVVTSPVTPPNPAPVLILSAGANGAAVSVTSNAPYELWWTPWSSPPIFVESAIQQIDDVRPNGAFLYTAGNGAATSWTIGAFDQTRLGIIPSSAGLYGALYVDDTHVLYVDSNSDLRLIDLTSYASQVVQSSNVHGFDFHPKTRTLAFVRRSLSGDPTDGLWIGTLP